MLSMAISISIRILRTSFWTRSLHRASVPRPTGRMTSPTVDTPAIQAPSPVFTKKAATTWWGPGSILGNLNTGLGAAHAAHALSLQRNIDAGAQTVIRRASPSVTINHYVTLYEGNTTGKGKPRPKLRIRNLPIQTVQPALGPHAKHNPRTRTTTAALKGADLKKADARHFAAQAPVRRQPDRQRRSDVCAESGARHCGQYQSGYSGGSEIR